MTASLPLLQPRLLLGLRTNIQGNAQFVSDDDVVYPVGGVVTVHNFHQKRQKYIKLADKGRNLTSVVVSPNKKYIALAESGEKPTVTLWCPETFKKKRQINLPSDRECTANHFVVVAFTFDSKFIVCITGEPDWTLYYIKADKGRLESFTRANNANGTGSTKTLACNPNDANQLVIAGDNLIRILACTDYVWRQFGYTKSDQWNFTSAGWLSQDRLLLGTVDGKLLILESGELKAIFNAADLPTVNLKFRDELAQGSQGSLNKPASSTTLVVAVGEDPAIRSLTVFPRGFAFGYLKGTVHLYEMETPQKFIKRNVFKIPDHTIVKDYQYDDDVKDPGNLTQINSISINPSQSKLMVTCNESQIYNAQLWMQDINSSPEVAMTEHGYPLHNGPIGSMAVCSWKPILLTAGETDRTLKIWNYEREDLELEQKWRDDLYSVDLHPTGLYSVVGFSDKLRFLTIMIDEFLVTKEFPVRMCRQCSFSRMGYLFAASNGNVIQVYSSVTFDMLYALKGHGGQVTGMSWTLDDRKMCSCGDEGAIYEWIVQEQKRSAEIIEKSLIFRDVSMTCDGKSAYVVSTDGHIREVMNSNIHRDVAVTNFGLDSIKLSNIDQMMFVSGNSGSVYVVKLPLLEKAEFVEYTVHSSPVTKILISYDDRYLLTGSSDGSICFWKLLNTEGKAIKMDKDFAPSTDILISRQILEEKLNQIKNLQLRLKELETEFAYQLRQNDVIHNLRMKDVHSGYCAAIEELKEKNEALEAEHIQEVHNINLDIKQMRKDHENSVKDLEANFNEKLIFEYEKYMRLEEKMSKMRHMYDKELDDLRKAKLESEEEITNDFLEKLQEKEMSYEELVEKTIQKEKAHELIKLQIEDDADREIYELREVHAKELKEEQELNVKIRGETSILKKKLLTSQKEIDDLKQNVFVLEHEHGKFKRTIVNLEKDVADLKKEIAERDATVQEKEKRIFDLKRKNQELEKFKFILDFKIKELKSQIEPREKTIQEQKEQINEMVRELENLQKVILSLDLQLHELREKLNASDEEVRKEIERNIVMKRALKKIKTEIYKASSHVQDIPKLIKSVKDMYHKFTQDEDFEQAQVEDTEVKCEFTRQREFLERTVLRLQRQVNKSTSTLSNDKVRLIEENASLIVETNTLRKNWKSERKENSKMKSMMGINVKFLPPKVVLERVKNATATRDEIKSEYKKELENFEKAVGLLEDENDRLLVKLLGEPSEELENEKVSEKSEEHN